MTYQPFLAEAAAGSIEPRHVVVPLRKVLRSCRVVTATVEDVDHVGKVATATRPDGERMELHYDVLVMAPGSIARPLPVPGLAESAISFKTLGEAIYLRNHVLSRLDLAAGTDAPSRRRRRLTFVVVGGGYSGVEIIAELEDMARYALRLHPELAPSDLRWVLVEASDRILPEVSPSLGTYTAQRLRKRGIEVRFNTRVESMVGGHVVLSDGAQLDADTIVWTVGVRANPLAARAGLPVDVQGRLVCNTELQVRGVGDVWSAGDSAAVRDLSRTDDPRALCGPTAQHAVRQAKRLADNIIATLRGRSPKPYQHPDAGSVASLGLHKGVAEIYGIRLRGWLAWFMHRAYHVSIMPTFNRKARIVADWTLALVFRREVVSLEQVQQPRQVWQSAVRSAETTATGVAELDIAR
ncbi:MAG: NAD(P)/FAD-dependent oxidoreductase [Jiangellaceae bacterium]